MKRYRIGRALPELAVEVLPTYCQGISRDLAKTPCCCGKARPDFDRRHFLRERYRRYRRSFAGRAESLLMCEEGATIEIGANSTIGGLSAGSPSGASCAIAARN